MVVVMVDWPPQAVTVELTVCEMVLVRVGSSAGVEVTWRYLVKQVPVLSMEVVDSSRLRLGTA